MAEITIVADEGGIVRVGSDEVTLEPGQSVAVEHSERKTRRKPIFVPDVLKPGAHLIARTYEESAMVSAFSEEEMASWQAGQEVTLELRGARALDVGQLDAVADQADVLGVAMTVRLRGRTA